MSVEHRRTDLTISATRATLFRLRRCPVDALSVTERRTELTWTGKPAWRKMNGRYCLVFGSGSSQHEDSAWRDVTTCRLVDKYQPQNMQAEGCRQSTLLSADPETRWQQLSVSATVRQTVTHKVTSIKYRPAEDAEKVLRNFGVFKLPETAVGRTGFYSIFFAARLSIFTRM